MKVNKYARFFTIVFIFNRQLKMFGKLRSSLRKSLRWKSSRDRHANRGGDGGDAILGGGSSSAGSSVPHHAASSASSSHHGDATPSHSGGSGVAASTADNNTSIANNKVPRQWQLDESAVRAGTCAFAVKYLGCAEVFESRGMHVCEQALVLLRDNVVHRKPQRAILYVTGEGLRVVDSKSRNLLVDQTIEKVSFCSPDRNHSKGFAYICRDGTTRRWICHGFNAVADTGERLSHAVGCAFQECLQRKQLREKQLRVKQQNEPAPTGIQSNTADAARLSLTTIEAAVPKPMVTGNQMNSNFQRNTHRTQSLADRRIDPQAFVKVDKSTAAPVQQQQPNAADNGVDLQPQEFRRAQSSRVFSTQFVRQRLRSSIRGPVPTSTNASQQSPQNDAPRSSQQQQFADSAMRQNVDGGFYNPSINFASPTGPEPQPALSSAHYGTNSTFLPAFTASNSISSPSYNNSPPPPPPPASSLTMQNEILDLVSRINNQDFSGGGLSSVKTTATADAAFSPQQHATGLRLSRPYVTPSLPQSRPTVDTSTTSPWSYAARYSVGGGVPPVVANRNAVPIPPRNTMQNSTNRTTTAVGAENTQNSSFFTNGSSNVNRTIPQRPNQLPTVPLKHQHPGTVVEEEEDPFSPPGWVDKSLTGFAPFSPLEKVADQQQRDESVRTWSPVPVDYNSNTFHNNSSPQVTPLKQHQQHQRSSAFGVPFNQLREEENGVLAAGGGGGSRTRTPTPAGPTMSAANGTVDSGMVYVPADYFVRQKKSSNNVQESDPFNTTWVKLDTE